MGFSGNCAIGGWVVYLLGFNKIFPEPRAEASRWGVGEPSGELIGMAHF